MKKLPIFCLRNRLNGKIIRACDKELTLADSHEYTVCDLASGPKECIDPPDYSPYGYTSRVWDGTKVLLSRVSYYCEPPKVRIKLCTHISNSHGADD